MIPSQYSHFKYIKGVITPTTRVCAIYRTPFGCYENLIRSDLFINSTRRSVKKVHSAIKLCSYYFSYNACNDINVTETH